MKNWKTTLGGLCSGIGAGIVKEHGWLGIVGQVLCVLGPVLLGAAAKDSNVTGGTTVQ